jgi:hypothetical protein
MMIMMSTRLGFHWHSATGWRLLHPRALPASILDRDPGLDLSHGGWPTPGRVPDHPPAILDGPGGGTKSMLTVTRTRDTGKRCKQLSRMRTPPDIDVQDRNEPRSSFKYSQSGRFEITTAFKGSSMKRCENGATRLKPKVETETDDLRRACKAVQKESTDQTFITGDMQDCVQSSILRNLAK